MYPIPGFYLMDGMASLTSLIISVHNAMFEGVGDFSLFFFFCSLRFLLGLGFNFLTSSPFMHVNVKFARLMRYEIDC